jgi:hypothetical protein
MILNSVSVELVGVGAGEVEVEEGGVDEIASVATTVGRVETVATGEEAGRGVAPPQAARSQAKIKSNRQDRIFIS